MSTDCVEASAEVVRFNRDTSAKASYAKQRAGASASSKRGGGDAAAVTAASSGPVVEHVAFSKDGKVSPFCILLYRVAVYLVLSMLLCCGIPCCGIIYNARVNGR